MKMELKLLVETLEDEMRIESALRTTDILYALKEVVSLTNDLEDPCIRGKVTNILKNLEVWHLVNP